MRPITTLAAIAALSLAGAAFAADAPELTATAQLKAGNGADGGAAEFTDAPGGVLLRVKVSGLAPGWHGLHFHEKGDCGAPDFKSAGAHVHGTAAAVHGLLNPAANESGDLPNIYVAADGTGQAEIFTPAVSLRGAGGRPALLDADGSALVVHANADDHRSQPIGGAGGRALCGVVTGR